MPSTPPDVRLIFAIRIARLFAYGSSSVVLALYLAQAGLRLVQPGGLARHGVRVARWRRVVAGALASRGFRIRELPRRAARICWPGLAALRAGVASLATDRGPENPARRGSGDRPSRFGALEGGRLEKGRAFVPPP